jgi:hypothetical protein
MRNDKQETFRVGSLSELDALVGTYLTEETPQCHWEDSETQLRFSSVEEALDAMQDPFFRQFAPEDESRPTVLTEVKLYRRYSTDLSVAWAAVERLSGLGEPLQVRRVGEGWSVAFGDGVPVTAPSAPMAICLAALRAKGLAVEVDPEEILNAAPYQEPHPSSS